MGSSPNYSGAGTRSDWWARTRWPRYTFGIGLIAGIFLGWIFHGVVGFVIRFGIIAAIILVLIGLFFLWRAWTGRGKTNVTVVRWDHVEPPPRGRDGPA